MKKLLFPLLIVLSLSLIFIFRESIFNPFQKKILINKTMTSLNKREISQYRSIGYTHKALFPYDFLSGEPNWGLILMKDEKFLNDIDIKNLNFYYKCRDIGIDLNKNRAFFIIETRATAGFDLDNYLKEPVKLMDYENRTIYLKNPKAELLNIEIVDKLNNENFPSLKITPKQWKELIELLLPLIEEEIKKRNFLEESEIKNREFLTSIYRTIGWEEVQFK